MKEEKLTMIVEDLLLIPVLTVAFSVLFAIRVSLLNGAPLDLTARGMWGTGFMVALFITAFYELGPHQHIFYFDWRVIVGSINLAMLGAVLVYRLLPVETTAGIFGMSPRALQDSGWILAVLDGLLYGGLAGLMVCILDRQTASMRIPRFVVLFALLTFFFLLVRVVVVRWNLNDTWEGALVLAVIGLLDGGLRWWKKRNRSFPE